MSSHRTILPADDHAIPATLESVLGKTHRFLEGGKVVIHPIQVERRTMLECEDGSSIGFKPMNKPLFHPQENGVCTQGRCPEGRGLHDCLLKSYADSSCIDYRKTHCHFFQPGERGRTSEARSSEGRGPRTHRICIRFPRVALRA